jgi:hypothetical protein
MGITRDLYLSLAFRVWMEDAASRGIGSGGSTADLVCLFSFYFLCSFWFISSMGRYGHLGAPGVYMVQSMKPAFLAKKGTILSV